MYIFVEQKKNKNKNHIHNIPQINFYYSLHGMWTLYGFFYINYNNRDRDIIPFNF